MVLNHCNQFARIIVCGMISQYNITNPKEKYGVKTLEHILPKKYLHARISCMGISWNRYLLLNGLKLIKLFIRKMLLSELKMLQKVSLIC